ncbi:MULTISPECIES: heat-inducible transcriptional repressor HrcA [Cetobacterium]|jgi:heat-inducible transcriptional repressor|uniref:Heat-inducible transcription repressor HrcA n=1 Tax=Candidatus Cetobacterium colombiensis TaxID=3073100 RepID=A0ABU4WD08_9FUSO|nr:heat-inducible transcriptional repressor HrcA [Candidatus Cetobacterium colombiensis]MDX8336456.1 heat-inducible transcriptional repressor HrcA [Candidatus Cetobacterium colombiensis]
MVVSDREKLVLSAIIDFYLLSGETIGSRTLVKKYNIDLSSATIRNVMSDLEDMGFIVKTHTSSGRIPTDKGYKFYLEELLKVEKLSREEQARINSVYEIKMRELDSVLKKTSMLLSKLTNYVGIVIEPTHKKEKIKKVELVHIDDYMAMAVIVMENKSVRTKKIFFDEVCTQDELFKLSQEINREIRNNFIESHEIEKIIDFVYGEVEGKLFLENSSEIFKDKQVNEISDVLDIFSKREKIKELFEEAIKSKPFNEGEVNVIFGEELAVKGLEDYSFVYSVYNMDNSPGIIGVMGPKRMSYSKTMGLIQHVTKEVNKVIKEIGNEGDHND